MIILSRATPLLWTFIALLLAMPVRAGDLCADLNTVIHAAPSFAAVRARAVDKYVNKARVALTGFEDCSTNAPEIDAWGAYRCTAGPFDETEARNSVQSLIESVSKCLAGFEHPAQPLVLRSRGGGYSSEETPFTKRGSRLAVTVKLVHTFRHALQFNGQNTPDVWWASVGIAGGAQSPR